MALSSHKLGSDEVRRKWRDVLDEVMKGESVMVLRSGKPVAAIIPFAMWDRFKDDLEAWDDAQDLLKSINAYRRGVAAGTVEREEGWDRMVAEEIAAGLLPAEVEEEKAAA